MGEVVAAATLWGLFAAWLSVPLVAAPVALARTAGALFWLELLALLWWGYGGSELARAAAFQDIPLLSLAVLAAGAVHGLRGGSRIGRRHPG